MYKFGIPENIVKLICTMFQISVKYEIYSYDSAFQEICLNSCRVIFKKNLEYRWSRVN